MTAVCVIAALYFGREVIIPFALAVLLSFLLTYPVTWLERLKLGRSLSVVIVLVIVFSAGGALIWIGAQQFGDIMTHLPEYQQNVDRKLEAMRHPAGFGLARIAGSIQQITSELSPAMAAAAHVLATVAAVVVLTLFMLLRRSDLRNRLFRLFGKGRINLMTTALDDAASRVSRYLLTQSGVNGTYGLLLGLGLWGIGVPYATFWGVSAVFLRFIPYIGTLIAGGCPVLLSIAVFDGWRKPLLALAVFAVVELAVSSLVEPWLYATRTGISSLAILLSAAFWTMLWGPLGLLLSTPLTVLLLVMGRHVAKLEFLYVLLGDEPVLAPEAHYYQRLLAFDEDEARDVAETYLEEHAIPQLYDAVLIPALSLAEQDRHDDQLDNERQRFVYQSTRDLIDELGDRAAGQKAEAAEAAEAEGSPSILCIPARDEADELVALMLAQVFRSSGYQAQSIASGFIEDMVSGVERHRPDVLFISALPPFAVTHARSICRKVQKRYANTKVVIGLWSATPDRKTIQQRLGSECSDHVVHSLAEAQLLLRLFVGPEPEASTTAEPQPVQSV